LVDLLGRLWRKPGLRQNKNAGMCRGYVPSLRPALPRVVEKSKVLPVMSNEDTLRFGSKQQMLVIASMSQA